jgi:benzoyl-CoA reductase/2-hydroxyglutaryl-CoA dehydratase subunit BcrC/BadD/HgdB
MPKGKKEDPVKDKVKGASRHAGIADLKSKVPRYITPGISDNVEFQRERTIEASKKQVQRELDGMRKMPGRPKAMEYFEKVAEFFTARADEVRLWKEQGGKVVGTLCLFIPHEIIDAAGALPLRVGSGFHEAVHPANELLADAGLCPMVKATLGCKMVESSPFLTMSDMLVGPTPCDAKTKLAEILQDYMPVLVINMPRIKSGSAVRRLWIDEIHILMDRLEELTGNKITPQALKRSVEKYHKAHLAWRRFMDIRKRGNVIWGRDALLIAQLSDIDNIERWAQNLQKLCDELEARTGKPEECVDKERPRILLGGSHIVWPNWKIPTLIEETGGIIAADELCSGMRVFRDPVVSDENSLESLVEAVADKYFYPCTCPSFSPNLEREDNILNMIKDYKIEGVIYHVLRGCHLNALDSTKVDVLLKANKMPVLKIETEYDEGDVEQIRTRIEAFLEMIFVKREFEGKDGKAAETKGEKVWGTATPVESKGSMEDQSYKAEDRVEVGATGPGEAKKEG